ncbi:MAG: hypothetical protein ACLR78_00170 [Roseburia sp.]
MEIILNILFFSILATFCVQIFFKGYQLSKSTEKTASGSDRMHVDRRNLPEYGFPEETLSSIYPESMSLNETILIYYNKDFLACGKQNAVYRATVDFYRISLPPSTSPFWIPALLKHFMNCQLPAISQFP